MVSASGLNHFNNEDVFKTWFSNSRFDAAEGECIKSRDAGYEYQKL